MREAQVRLEVVGGGMGPNLPHELNQRRLPRPYSFRGTAEDRHDQRDDHCQHRDAEDRVKNSLPFD